MKFVQCASRMPSSPEVSEADPALSENASRLPSVHFLLHGSQKPLPSHPANPSNLLSLGSTYFPFVRDLAKHAISTTASASSASEYAHPADPSRSNPLPLSSAYTIKPSAPTVSHTQGHSQSLMWITETTEDELGKTSITSFVNEKGSPDGSRADLKCLPLVRATLVNAANTDLIPSCTDARHQRSGKCGSRSTAICLHRRSGSYKPQAKERGSPVTCGVTYLAKAAAPRRHARYTHVIHSQMNNGTHLSHVVVNLQWRRGPKGTTTYVTYPTNTGQ